MLWGWMARDGVGVFCIALQSSYLHGGHCCQFLALSGAHIRQPTVVHSFFPTKEYFYLYYDDQCAAAKAGGSLIAAYHACWCVCAVACHVAL